VQGGVASVGNYAGGMIGGVGNSVNGIGAGIGNSVTNLTRYLGQGVAGYGNDLKDKVGAGGPRVAVAGNPLGLAGQGSSKAQAPGQKSVGGPTSGGGRGSAANPLGI